MRKIVVTEFLSLDGVMEDPRWSLKYWNDEISNFKSEEGATTDALLLGRVTYEGFAAAWPNSQDEGAAWINSVRKYVVSTTLEQADWNNSVIISDKVVEEIRRLKAQEGQDLLVYGSATLIQTLMEHDLVDSYRILLYPELIGQGKRLFREGAQDRLQLVESRVLSGGVLALVYEPRRSEA